MANPQKEKGFVGIAYDLFEQFFIRDFSILQLKMLLLIVRFSYGFGKKVAKIKPQRLFELAYIYRCDVKEEIRYLRQNKVITCNFELGEIQINKNYDEWKIPYHKLFNEDDLARLKKINLEAKQLAKEFGYADEVTPENVCSEQTDVFVENKQNSTEKNKCLPTTNNIVCGEQTDVFVENKHPNAENIGTGCNTSPSIYNNREYIENNNNIFINKEKNNFQNSDKKNDPFINSYASQFKKTYKEIFGQSPYLLKDDLFNLAEIVSCIPDFEENLRIALEKLKNLKFPEIDFKPNANWLLAKNHFASILNGEYDKYIEKTEPKYTRDEGWDL